MGRLNRFILIFLIVTLLGYVIPTISSAYSDTNSDELDTRYQQHEEDWYRGEEYYADYYYERHYYIKHLFITGFIILWILWSLMRRMV